MELDVGASQFHETWIPPNQARPARIKSLNPLRRHSLRLSATLLLLALSGCHSEGKIGDTLARVKSAGALVYGSDQEGGGPYIFPDPDDPGDVTGFEVEMLQNLARGLGVRATFSQGQWDRLLQNLDAGHVDLVVNGYEWNAMRARGHLYTRPYYVYRLQLMSRKDSPVKSWEALKTPGKDGRKWRVGVLVASAADIFAEEHCGNHIEVVRFDGSTDAMSATVHGQIDATLQDLPAATFYRERFPDLAFAGEPVGSGYYVMYFRKGDESLRDAVDAGIGNLLASGELRRLYERYDIWNDAQEELSRLSIRSLNVTGGAGPTGWLLLSHYFPSMLKAALVTLCLSFAAMPLAMLIGLSVALGRIYGPRPVRWLLAGYVELLRGTPLMLQLYVLYFLVNLSAWQAGILGLAVNYSAYEAEIYRAGLQAIPAGQMEAALALGMSRRLALRRVIVPQAVRIVIPPVTNDFIAMFKDTSVCSVITLVELTKRYSILANSTGGVVEFALAASVLYLAMSLPLSWFSRWSERRLAGVGPNGGVLA